MTSDVRPYTGVRILDLTHTFGRYAPRLFADLGAEVIRIEPPEGLPDRARIQTGRPVERFAFEFLNAGKRSVTLDLTQEAERSAFSELMTTASVIFLERGAPLADEVAWIRGTNPGAIVSYVSPYGMDGPLGDAAASDLVLQAAGGIAWLSGRLGEPPLRLPFDQATMVTSVYAAVATAIALMHAELLGQGHVIDVSVQECIAHSLQNTLQVYDLNRRVAQRGGAGTQDASEGVFECKDGRIYAAMGLGTGRSWENFVTWARETGHPSGKEFAHERWADAAWRHTEEAMHRFRGHFEAFTANRTIEEVLRETLKRGLLIAPVNRVSDLFSDPQLKYRQFFVNLPWSDEQAGLSFPGAPYKMSDPVWQTRRAPTLGQDNGRYLSRQ